MQQQELRAGGAGARGSFPEARRARFDSSFAIARAANHSRYGGAAQPAPTAQPAPAVPATQNGPRGRLEPLSVDRFGVHFTADAEFRELLEEVRALASHAQPNGELLPMMKHALEAYRRELLKKRFGVGRKPRRARSVERNTERAVKRSRHVRAEVRREVCARDGGCCAFESGDGRGCSARTFLELDHIHPWAEGGESTDGNLRLRCRAHNQHAARAHFGGDLIRVAIASAQQSSRVFTSP
jgi:hypothetical protein